MDKVRKDRNPSLAKGSLANRPRLERPGKRDNHNQVKARLAKKVRKQAKEKANKI